MAAPSGCAEVRTDLGQVRINAPGHWVRSVTATGPDNGDRFYVLPAESMFTDRSGPMISNGVRRTEGSRLPGESPIAVTVQYIASFLSDEDAIRAAVANIPRLSDGQYPVPALQRVSSPAQFTRTSGFFNLEPGNNNVNDDLYPNGPFVGGGHIVYQSRVFGLHARLTHEFWHPFVSRPGTNVHPTNGGIGDVRTQVFDSTDNRVIAAIFRMLPNSRAADYGLGGTVGAAATVTELGDSGSFAPNARGSETERGIETERIRRER